MNIRKIKLALTIGLMNTSSNQKSALKVIKELMQGFKSEVGAFLGWSVIKNAALDTKHIQRSYKVQFENCSVDLDMIINRFTKNHYVSSFQLQ